MKHLGPGLMVFGGACMMLSSCIDVDVRSARAQSSALSALFIDDCSLAVVGAEGRDFDVREQIDGIVVYCRALDEALDD